MGVRAPHPVLNLKNKNMPYVTCPDGKTYSRYDQSDYVKWCICNEKEQEQKKFQECMEDPICKKEYLHKQEVSKNILIYGGGIMLTLLVIIFWKLFKAI